MKKNKNIHFKVSLLLLFASFAPKVYASIGTVNIPSVNLQVNEEKIISLSVSDNIQSVDGMIKSNDPSCVKVVNVDSPLEVDANNKFANFGLRGAITDAGTVTIKGLKKCNTKLTIYNLNIVSIDEIEERDLHSESGIITVNGPDTNDLSTTQTNNQIITPSKTEENNTVNKTVSQTTNNNVNKTNNNVNNSNANKTTNQVSSNTNKQTTNSSNPNSTARSINNQVAVTNNDATLSSLSIEGYQIDFDKNKFEYVLEVSNEVEKVNVNATSSDSKSTIKIEGNENLFVGENEIKIIVTNNNEEKLYIIKVTRKQDPTKEYNTDNYLTNIIPSSGILSPLFDKNKSDYVIYLPYEVDNITFENTLSADTSNVEIEGPDKLALGNNNFTIKVRAESGDIRKYQIVVKRFNKYDVTLSNNNLRNITLGNNNTLLNSLGKKVDFDKDVTTYYYKKGDDFSYNYVVDDKDAIVKVVENNDTINIIVEAPNGHIKVYTLIPYEQNPLIYILLFILGITIGYLLRLVIAILKRNKRRKINQKKSLEN